MAIYSILNIFSPKVGMVATFNSELCGSLGLDEFGQADGNLFANVC